jgi:cytochrome c553
MRRAARARWIVRASAIALLLLCPLTAGGAEPPDSRLAACLACHGEKGQSALPEVPSLGGQPAFYLTVQMLMFRDRLRAVDVMNKMMQGFSDGDLQKMGDLIARLPPPQPAGGPADSARMEKGRTLAEQNRCNFCHQGNYSGERNVPRLAGQREDYLVKALREYRDNSRRGYDASMADVLYHVSDEQILDLAYFLARMR